MKFEVGQKIKLRNGECLIVMSVNLDSITPVSLKFLDGSFAGSYFPNGKFNSTNDISQFDIVEIIEEDLDK